MTINKKITDSGYRVLEVFKLLKTAPASVQDILQYFERENTIKSIETPETVMKYINTLRFFGFDIKKYNNAYHLRDNFIQFDFTDNELKTLAFMNEYVGKIKETKIKNIYFDFAQKIENIFFEDTQKRAVEIKNSMNYSKLSPLNFEQDKKIIEKLEKYCTDELKLKIKYLNHDNELIEVVVEPVSIIYKYNKVFLKAYNQRQGNIQEIFINAIKEISQMPVKNSNNGLPKSVTFKVCGRLLPKYVLRSGEKVIEKADDYMVVVNQHEDKESILKRLLKYQNCVEIMYPSDMRDLFLKLIDETLENYKK